MEDDTVNNPAFRLLAYASRLSRFSRYLAFTSDVGEAFRPVISNRIVNACYGVSFTYVAYDIYSHAHHSIKKGNDNMIVARTVIERSIFQGLASLYLPAVTIHSVVKLGVRQVKNHPNLYIKRWFPSTIGLLTLPLLPIIYDEPVEYGVDYLFKNLWPIEGVR